MDKNFIKSILFLDANESVVDSIKYAKRNGYRVITCDNIPSHIGHQYADKSYNISTYDVETLERVVNEENISGVVYFASAHGLYGGSRIIEKFSLAGIPLHVEQQFSNKGKFRKMLKEIGIPNPVFQIVRDSASINYHGKFPCIVKPVDSSGGNIGITKVYEYTQLQEAVDLAISVSFSNEALIEEFIDSDLQINGDCIVFEGTIKYLFLGKHLFFENSITPYATIFGSDVIPNILIGKIKDYLQKIILKENINEGTFNLELRLDRSGNLFFIEINPRHSGNRIYKLMNRAYNISCEKIAVDLSLGNKIDIQEISPKGFFAYCILYSKNEGILDSIEISDELDKYILYRYDFVHKGDKVNCFKLLRDRLSLLLLEFKTKREQDYIMNLFENLYSIRLI